MANPLRGEVELRAWDATYTLALGTNAIAELEQLLDVSVLQVAEWFADPGEIRASRMRAILWAALQRHHKGITLEQAGDAMDLIGLPRVVEALGEAVQAAFPATEGQPENPPQRARAGTGKRSSSTTSGSASRPSGSGS